MEPMTTRDTALEITRALDKRSETPGDYDEASRRCLANATAQRNRPLVKRTWTVHALRNFAISDVQFITNPAPAALPAQPLESRKPLILASVSDIIIGRVPGYLNIPDSRIVFAFRNSILSTSLFK
jgi:hypothetical protein